MTWKDILTHWPQLELDLHSTFGVDVESGVLSDRSWRWLAMRIKDLLGDSNSRLSKAVKKPR